MSGIVVVTRGGLVESRHYVHVVVAHADWGVVASCGHAQHVSFVRSAIKMFQAPPLDAVAIACAHLAAADAAWHRAQGRKRDAPCVGAGALAALDAVKALTDAELNALRALAQPPIDNTRGDVVGEIRAELRLH